MNINRILEVLNEALEKKDSEIFMLKYRLEDVNGKLENAQERIKELEIALVNAKGE